MGIQKTSALYNQFSKEFTTTKLIVFDALCEGRDQGNEEEQKKFIVCEPQINLRPERYGATVNAASY